ncbi:hypothetical protein SAMN05216223_109203 [Actinacidiphila yanglinensis]|uniref:Uncharacterized protein n=1 Tax=Actinacidiphila yanglinensis TaxID=310779 RepID=A0A1H6CMD9_9ACTN|nr:hypothetical protein [Actinacidiphila yanglinensis]SEG74209.1 hypothetical protein SAMN05216223_109203 [Actinacidiphila yanglinensis]
MRNHVRHSRSVRMSPAVERPDRDLVLAPAGIAPEATENAGYAGYAGDTADTEGVETAEAAEDTAGRIGPEYLDGIEDDGIEEDLADVVRLACPDCGRPIAVTGDDVVLPSHAVCPNPWQPFGLTVCGGSGRAVADAGPLEPLVVAAAGEPPAAVLPKLPTGLDWRTQPFSHVGGPGSQPIRVPLPREAGPLAA